ncbi:MAG: tRNA-(ms[2]io[6]A)-hydroxylase [Pseudohongiellaceae bacterium]|jgi:tRNA-(ms[2]io[6]A)-hydroxylase
MDFSLQESTSKAWLDAVMADFDSFLLDHASCEKKASGMAISMISHYPDKPDLVKEMLNLAIEEMSHFRDVVRIILDRQLEPAADGKDEYVNRLHKAMDKGKEAYMLDRLLIASIVEARGAERFGMIAAALAQGKLKKFYQAITDSESRHYQLFLNLAEIYYEETAITPRLNELLDIEAQIIKTLPFRAALH